MSKLPELLNFVLPIVAKHNGTIYGGFIRDVIINKESHFKDVDIVFDSKDMMMFIDDLQEQCQKQNYNYKIRNENHISKAIQINSITEKILLDITKQSREKLIQDSYTNLLLWKPTYEIELPNETNFETNLTMIENDRKYQIADIVQLIQEKSFILLPQFKEALFKNEIESQNSIIKMKENVADLDISKLLTLLRL